MGDFLSFSSPLSERLRVCDLVLPSSSLPRMWVLAWGRREGEGDEEEGEEEGKERGGGGRERGGRGEGRGGGGGRKREGEGLSNSGTFQASKKKREGNTEFV